MSLNYLKLLKKSWKIIWKYKILWIFGILASCSVRNGSFSTGGSSNFRAPSTNYGNNNFNFGNTPMPPAIRSFFFNIQRMAYNGQLWQTLIIVGIVVLLLVIILRLVMAVVGTIGQIALINGTYQVEEGAGKLGFGALVSDGWKHFWKVILFKLILFAVNLVVGVILLVSLLVTLGLAICCLFLPILIIGFVYWILVNYALVALVGDNMGVIDSITKGWNLFTKNWITSAIMGLLVAVIEFVYDIIMAIPFILTLIPGFIGVMTSISTRSDTGLYPGLIASGILLLIYIPIAIFLNGVKVAYFGVNWTLVYRSLTAGEVQNVPAAEVETPAADLPPASDLPPADEEPPVLG